MLICSHDDLRVSHRGCNGFVWEYTCSIDVQFIFNDHVFSKHRHILHTNLHTNVPMKSHLCSDHYTPHTSTSLTHTPTPESPTHQHLTHPHTNTSLTHTPAPHSPTHQHLSHPHTSTSLTHTPAHHSPTHQHLTHPHTSTSLTHTPAPQSPTPLTHPHTSTSVPHTPYSPTHQHLSPPHPLLTHTPAPQSPTHQHLSPPHPLLTHCPTEDFHPTMQDWTQAWDLTFAPPSTVDFDKHTPVTNNTSNIEMLLVK